MLIYSTPVNELYALNALFAKNGFLAGENPYSRQRTNFAPGQKGTLLYIITGSNQWVSITLVPIRIRRHDGRTPSMAVD
jgi:hypothetical protein